MDKLLAFINGLPLVERDPWAARCDTTVNYLRKACYAKQKLSEGLCLRIAVESGGVVPLKELRTDIDWSRIKAMFCTPELGVVPSNKEQQATESVAQGV